VQHDLQQTMHDLVGIIRTEPEMREALERIAALKERVANLSVEGHRQYNPGWNLAIDLRNMLLVSECVAKAALQRTESRGGHTRDDHPSMDSSWRNVLLVCRAAGGDEVVPDITITREDQTPMRADLLELFEISELEKYYTDEELADHPGRTPRTES
jgi:succinate dehydrogenase / fumarate reductase flavoprotein subunit